MYISLHTSKSSVNVSSAKKDAAYIWFGDVSFDGMHAYSPHRFNTTPSLLSSQKWNQRPFYSSSTSVFRRPFLSDFSQFPL